MKWGGTPGPISTILEPKQQSGPARCRERSFQRKADFRGNSMQENKATHRGKTDLALGVIVCRR